MTERPRRRGQVVFSGVRCAWRSGDSSGGMRGRLAEACGARVWGRPLGFAENFSFGLGFSLGCGLHWACYFPL
ncbi:hypothetical protein ES332_D09G092900v1 [Gossypium tomentosum]|uniref:Uncharacterized protein n=1 Tax=Gossypium tomentosum TaxID=34277 RepID=A0A5D2JF90_GOSTO|nr:hypothetical protein ES332_D09G092900v1 [Gossypium tomentosum]